MTARYELREPGVHDNETGRDITPMDGAEWALYHEWLAVHGNAPDPVPLPPGPTIAEALAAKLSEIEQLATAQRRKVTGPASPQEMASWTLKAREALAYQANPVDTSAPMLAVEAEARGVTTDDIVARVTRNALAYSRAEAAIAGNAGRHRDAVSQLASLDEVLAYDASGGWPFMPPKPAATPFAGGLQNPG